MTTNYSPVEKTFCFIYTTAPKEYDYSATLDIPTNYIGVCLELHDHIVYNYHLEAGANIRCVMLPIPTVNVQFSRYTSGHFFTRLAKLPDE